MTQEIVSYFTMGTYVSIGVLYALINIIFRNMSESGEDPLLVFVWVFGWPLLVPMAIGKFIIKQIKKIKYVTIKS